MRIKHVKDVRKENGAGLRSGPVDFSEFTHTDCSHETQLSHDMSDQHEGREQHSDGMECQVQVRQASGV
jgi:hypothetical protein